MIRNYLGIKREDFQKYIVCPKCSAIYKPEDCGRKKGNVAVLLNFQITLGEPSESLVELLFSRLSDLRMKI